jgi:hypothetical protein
MATSFKTNVLNNCQYYVLFCGFRVLLAAVLYLLRNEDKTNFLERPEIFGFPFLGRTSDWL